MDTRSRLTRMIVLAALALATLAAIGWMLRPSAPSVAESAPSHAGALHYDAAIERVNAILAGATDLAAQHDDEWLFQERLANAHIARARLTGSFEDYAAADAALKRAFTQAPKGAGPHQAMAALDMSLHRLDAAAKMLDAIDHYAVKSEAGVQTELAGARGDIAFYRGDYAGAARIYAAADPAGEDSGISFRLANLQARTGDPDGALKTLDMIQRSARLPQAQFLADLALRRGAIALQRGDWDKAAADFDKAGAIFPGWWLVEAHRAQMLALRGDSDGAIARFTAILKASSSPDLMDALASLYRAKGDRVKASFWSDQARNSWNERLRLIPEAAWGHAIEHILAFGNPNEALPLAEADYRARPYGLTATSLGWVLIANNRPADALKVIEPVLRSKWVSAEAHLAAAQAHLLLGQTDAADREQRAALAINPRAADPASALIWFGH